MEAPTIQIWPHQADFLDITARIGALFGGIGCGKTFIGAWWHALKALRCPGSIGVIAGGVARTLRETTLPAIREVAAQLGVRYCMGRDPEKELGVRSHFERHSNILTWPNGAQDMIWSLAAGENLRGPEISRGWVDELRLGDKRTWDVFLGRFRSEANVDSPEVRVTSTPAGLDWMYTYFVRDPMKTPELAGERAYVHGKTTANLALPEWYVKMLLASYDETYARQEIAGEFIDQGQGMTYHEFNEARNVTTKKPDWFDSKGWWCVSFDFNVDPMACCLLKHHEGEIYVYDEIWLRNSNTPATCQHLQAWMHEHGDLTLHVYGDATGGARSTAGKSDYQIIRNAFPDSVYHVKKSNPPVRDRVNLLNGRLHSADGKVRLTLHPRCKNLIEDLELCQCDDDGHPLQFPNDDDFERKKRTHPSDALGYFVAREYPVRRRIEVS